jgi:hypothetical protein
LEFAVPGHRDEFSFFAVGEFDVEMGAVVTPLERDLFLYEILLGDVHCCNVIKYKKRVRGGAV